jgi:hypothetical protein
LLSNLHIEGFALLDDWVKENRIPLDCTVPWIQEVRGLGFKVERDSCRESMRLELKANGKKELKHCGVLLPQQQQLALQQLVLLYRSACSIGLKTWWPLQVGCDFYPPSTLS